MNIVLSVYSVRAFKEFVLPASNNMETAFTLRRDVFKTNEDIDLKLENIDSSWYFTESDQYWIASPDGKQYQRRAMQDGDYFKVFQNQNQILAIMVRKAPDQLPKYRKFNMKGQTLLIGIGQDCALKYSFHYEGHQYISQVHATISATQNGMTLLDSSKNGVFLNDIRVMGSCELHFGDQINIWGLSMVALGQVLAVRLCANLTIDEGRMHPGDVPGEETVHEEERVLHYHRSPRKMGRLESGVVEIEAPPNPQQMDETPLAMNVGPALTMALPMVVGSGMAVVGANSGGLFMYSGIITAVLSAAVGAAWAVVNVRYSHTKGKKEENHRFEAYGDYLVRVTENIRTKYEHNSAVLLDTYPAASQCLNSSLQGKRLWERNTTHEDFLTFRLGLGDCSFQVDIHIPPEKFELLNDSLREKPRMIQENFHVLHNVPVCIDLVAERIIGLVGGPDRTGARELVRLLTAQIAAQICYTDVKMVYLYREDQGSDPAHWGFCRWLPHVWSQDHRNRYIAANKAQASDVLYEIMRTLRIRSEMSTQLHSDNVIPKPWYILVIEDSSVLENEPIVKYLFDQKQKLGVTTLLLANQPEELPNACGCIIRNDATFTGIYHLQAEEGTESRIVFDQVDEKQLNLFARYLANVEVNEVEVGGELPNSITFFDMYGISRLSELNVEDRWKKNRTYENMRALIGQKAGNVPCYLDVHEKYHGPHGLVAGTTGSGKSETLQTYILSLAINFSPYDVGLFLIDYKGGGMANLFDGLPHMIGQISNLSGGQIHRAMVSIKSENLRRQKIFNASGVNNINLYTHLFKNGEATIPIPHLFIIIDEFAELKREQPDFMRELISVAQVGRSLGVHLILATQKPSGTVDDNIWSNSKFRVCLRVQDRQDSMDMLHKPDAAYLTQAGRGFLQVGSDEVYEQFQSGWSGAVYDEDSDVGSKIDLVRMLQNTGKTELTGNFQKRRQKEQIHLKWLNQLLGFFDEARKRKTEPLGTIYQLMAEQRVNYAQSEYNDKVLQSFMDLTVEVEKSGVTGKQRAKAIDQLAKDNKIKLPEAKEKTQLDAVVEYLAAQAVEQGYEPLPPLWLNPLPTEKFYLENIEGWQEATFDGTAWPTYDTKWELSAIVGMCDDPAKQAQFPFVINFSKGGHHALIGSTASGKSTFVQTLLYSLIHRYTPAYLNIYVLDFSTRMTTPFAHAAQVGGILYENDVESVGKLFYLMRRIINERKKMFGGVSYEQYTLAHGVTCPMILFIIDNIANFREKAGEEYDDLLVQIAREAENCGIYLFITGAGYGITEIPNKLGDTLRTSFSLELTDIYQYGEALRGTQPPIFPESGVKGRGLANIDGDVLEFQTAQAMPAEDDGSRMKAIEEECARLNKVWKGAHARKIPLIPEKPTWNLFMQREELPEVFANAALLPIGYEYSTAGIYSIDLRRTFCYAVAGHPHSGKTNLLKVIMRSAAEKKMKLFVIENEGVSLRSESDKLGATYLSDLTGIIKAIGQIGPEFQKRHKAKMALAEKDWEDEEIFFELAKGQPWVIVIANLSDLVSLAYSEEGMLQNLHRALENLISKGFMHNIYFIAGIDHNTVSRMAGQPLYDAFAHYKTGIHLGGNVAGQRLFEFMDLPFAMHGLAEKPGSGFVPPNESTGTQRIILPLAKG